MNIRLSAQLYSKQNEKDSGLDQVHVAGIRDSANKLRSKMQAHAMKKHNQRTIDLHSASQPEVLNKFKNLSSSNISSPAPEGHKSKQDSVNLVQVTENYYSTSSKAVEQDVDIKQFDSKITFSAERDNKLAQIRSLEEKLQQTENMVLALQRKIESNVEGYNEKYNNMAKEIQELEADNIDLHQLVKAKLSEIQDLKNENLELNRKISSHSMINQKLNQTEEELQVKIEEIMNKTTELNFIIRQKEEEIQNLKRKNSMLQIDVNNARNVENSLNNEIELIQQSRFKIETEFKKIKDEL